MRTATAPLIPVKQLEPPQECVALRKRVELLMQPPDAPVLRCGACAHLPSLSPRLCMRHTCSCAAPRRSGVADRALPRMMVMASMHVRMCSNADLCQLNLCSCRWQWKSKLGFGVLPIMIMMSASVYELSMTCFPACMSVNFSMPMYVCKPVHRGSGAAKGVGLGCARQIECGWTLRATLGCLVLLLQTPLGCLCSMRTQCG